MDIIISSIQDIVSSLKTVGHVMSYVWFIALPPLFYFLFFELWMYHIIGNWLGSNNWMMLEIIPPKDVEKSPKPLELFFAGFAGVEKSFNPIEQYVQGLLPERMSLEIVSIEGSVHFYLRILKKYRNLTEAYLYAQYPDVEIVEVEDYTEKVPVVVPNTKWDLWGADVAPTAKHPAYPIRTYTAFEESITGKMIDPLAGLVEAMGKAGPGQQFWLQWVISPTAPSWPGTVGKELSEKLKGKEVKKQTIAERFWIDITDVFKNIFSGLNGEYNFTKAKKKEEQPLDMRLSPVERDVLKAVETNLGKLHFKVKGRYVYVGRKENFDKSLGVSSIWGGLKQFGDDNLNGFKPDGVSKTFANYIFKKSRLRYRQRKLFRRYKSRSMDGVTMFMSTEELATIFHLPDMSVMAPSITRVEAKRSGAPSNLPIE